MELMNSPGTRDESGKRIIVKDDVLRRIISIFRRYGFAHLDTPVIERFDVLSAKYAGGSEILKETFKLRDQGKRELCLRYDLTVPLARFIGMHKEIKMPFKRYQFGPVFRDGPVKLGRYREFWQCDADIVGAGSMAADAELLSMAQDIFKSLDIDASIMVNNRKLLNGIIRNYGVKEDDIEFVILTLDKIKKIGEESVMELLSERIGRDKSEGIMRLVSDGSGWEETLNRVENEIGDKEGIEGINELRTLRRLLDEFGVTTAVLDISLARGLSYYTGTVFEAFLKRGRIKSSIAAGGRYDRMIGSYLSSKEEIKAAGISFGIDVLVDTLQEREEERDDIDVMVIPIGDSALGIKAASEFRGKGLKTLMDIMGRGPGKNLSYCNSRGIRFAVLIGEKEKSRGAIKLRDLKDGSEQELGVEEAIKTIKSAIKN